MSGSTGPSAPAVTPASVTPYQPGAPSPLHGELWLRKLSVVITNTQTNESKELIVPITPEGDALHVIFEVKNILHSTPSTCHVRVYNLSNDTASWIANAGRTLEQMSASNDYASSNGQLVLKAGYASNYGTLFQGVIRQVKSGRENPTDTFTDIYAADSDQARNWGIINTSLSAGYSQKDVTEACVKYMQSFGVQNGTPPMVATDSQKTVPVTPPASGPRGRAMWGNVKDILRDVAASHDNTWNLDGNTLNFLPKTAFMPGDAVVLTSHTGMIGLPELQADGVHVRCLLNPAIGVGTRLQINNKSIQQPQINLATQASNQIFPPLSAASTNGDGLYKTLTIDHTGDNRGISWYSAILCISADPSAMPPVAGVTNLATGIPP